MNKKWKDIFATIALILMVAVFIFLTVIFPMLYDLSKAGQLNPAGIIKYVFEIVAVILIAAYVRLLL